MSGYFWRRKVVATCEALEDRRLLAGVSAVEGPACIAPLALAAEPQYRVHQTPRLQPGNAPLVGTPAYTGADQIDILWQTVTIGSGQADTFEVRYRPRGTDVSWQFATLNPTLDTGDDTRIIHSATITGLNWDADYEYRVLHLRAGEVLASYSHRFHTRLEPGDWQPFQFVAYGDSAIAPPNSASEGFRRVQERINQIDPDFSVLLGDNSYDYGTHTNADVRFSPEVMPAATEWIAGHVDYFGIGNHDVATDGGKPSRDSYSVPLPVEGVNAFASLPEGEHPEHTYSFDYGNTHFVTLDTNPVELPGPLNAARVESLIDFVATDLQASQAQWKIVYAHHPIIGTAKSYDDPNSLYFQRMLSRLVEAGADLLMVGHSHTYSWTHALTGFEDRNQDGVIGADEVNFVPDTNRTYAKGAGLIQLVAGVGGRGLTADPYGGPVFASTYSRSDLTGPIEFGFAQVDVTQHRLTVSYISAETGRIVGDTNGNWLADDDEPLFGRFQIVDAAVARGDLNGDGTLRDDDIDLLAAALRSGDDDPRYDLNDDAVNNAADYAMMVDSIVGASRGDANRDGVFGPSDLESIFRAGKYESPHSPPAMWADGDWNADGQFTSGDLILAFQMGSFRD